MQSFFDKNSCHSSHHGVGLLVQELLGNGHTTVFGPFFSFEQFSLKLKAI